MYRNNNDVILDTRMTEEEYIESYWGCMHEDAERILGKELSEEEFDSMLISWKAFSMNPRHYENSGVVDMVNQWLKEQRDKKNN